MQNVNDLLRGLRCPWCHSGDLYFDSNIQLTDPIGVKIACKQCFMRTPIGKDAKDAVKIFREAKSHGYPLIKQPMRPKIGATLISNRRE